MKRFFQKVRSVKRHVKEKRLIPFFTMIANFVAGAAKLVLGLFTLSFFAIVNGFYSFAVGAAKSVFLKGKVLAHDDLKRERKYYLLICLILAAASVLYMIYMSRLFITPETARYEGIFAITVAAVSFTELGVAVFGIIKSNKNRDLLLNGIKCVNLASAFAAIVFTQVALLAYAGDGADYNRYNAIGGVIFATLCLCICAYMVVMYIRSGRYLKRLAMQTADTEDNTPSPTCTLDATCETSVIPHLPMSAEESAMNTNSMTDVADAP